MLDIGGAGIRSPARSRFFSLGEHRGQAMTLDEAYRLIDAVVANIALKRADHEKLHEAVSLLHIKAKDNEEEKDG